MAMQMWDGAFKQLPNEVDLILHSGHGWQYQMRQYQSRLREKGIRQSMLRKGNCPDNAAMESF
jgi:transposase InsO family protein